MESLIQCHDIIKIHRGRGLDGIKKGYRAVDKVSLDIEKGSNFGLVGESGCGKTTLAKAILYLDPPTSGEVIFDGVILGSLKTRELRAFRRRMQIVFQDPLEILLVFDDQNAGHEASSGSCPLSWKPSAPLAVTPKCHIGFRPSG